MYVRRAALAAAVSLVLAVVVGCGEPDEPAAVPCPGGDHAWERTDGVLETAVSRRAADYAGPGPHPVLVVYDVNLLSPDLTHPVRTSGVDSEIDDFPPEWNPESGGVDAPGVQLVVCRYLANRGQGPVISSCDFHDRAKNKVTVPVEATTWAYRVWEARGSRFVTGFDLPGVFVKCPSMTSTHDGKVSPLVSVPSDRDLVEYLRPLVEGTMPTRR